MSQASLAPSSTIFDTDARMGVERSMILPHHQPNHGLVASMGFALTILRLQSSPLRNSSRPDLDC